MNLIQVATLTELSAHPFAEERGLTELIEDGGYEDDMIGLWSYCIDNSRSMVTSKDELTNLVVGEAKEIRMAHWGNGCLYQSNLEPAMKIRGMDGWWIWEPSDEREWML